MNCFSNLVAPFNSLLHNPNVPYNQVIQTNLHQALLGYHESHLAAAFRFRLDAHKEQQHVVRGGFGFFGDTFPGRLPVRWPRTRPS